MNLYALYGEKCAICQSEFISDSNNQQPTTNNQQQLYALYGKKCAICQSEFISDSISIGKNL